MITSANNECDCAEGVIHIATFIQIMSGFILQGKVKIPQLHVLKYTENFYLKTIEVIRFNSDVEFLKQIKCCIFHLIFHFHSFSIIHQKIAEQHKSDAS